MGFLVFGWSIQSHTSITIWGEFRLKLKHVLNVMALSLLWETNVTGATFEEEDEDKLQLLVASIGHSKATLCSKSMYASWIHILMKVKGAIPG